MCVCVRVQAITHEHTENYGTHTVCVCVYNIYMIWMCRALVSNSPLLSSYPSLEGFGRRLASRQRNRWCTSCIYIYINIYVYTMPVAVTCVRAGLHACRVYDLCPFSSVNFRKSFTWHSTLKGYERTTDVEIVM